MSEITSEITLFDMIDEKVVVVPFQELNALDAHLTWHPISSNAHKYGRLTFFFI
jgi:hypothetical protein